MNGANPLSDTPRNFYDIHFHAMNLGHPNILAFARRINWQLLLLASPLAPIVAVIGMRKFRNVLNLLSVMENDTGSLFMLIEYYLREKGLILNDVVTIGGRSFDGIIMTPLLMDFGYKNIPTDTFYKVPPRKPIVAQVEDVFNGIAEYCRNELKKVTVDGAAEYNVVPRESKAVFEIYPFLGINTKNYDLARIEKMLDKYFENYRGCYPDFKANLGKFEGNIDGMRSNFFAGVKLYPPIGFDPWPESAGERKKVEYLYEFCCAKGIPITVHCSDGGFGLDKNAAVYTCPERWATVLAQKSFETLKLNFAHFGKQNRKRFLFFSKNGWRSKVLELMRYPNVYADFSYIGTGAEHYRMLKQLVEANPHIESKLLFGSDFMINLLDMESYNSYLDIFSTTQSFSASQKFAFCTSNPERFLWRNEGVGN